MEITQNINISLKNVFISNGWAVILSTCFPIFLKSLPKREVICGFAEILKHAIIQDKVFFEFLKTNTNNILMLKDKVLVKSIIRSCKIKLNFTEKDFKEKNLRMILNFGHTFAHALEIQNKYSKKSYVFII